MTVSLRATVHAIRQRDIIELPASVLLPIAFAIVVSLPTLRSFASVLCPCALLAGPLSVPAFQDFATIANHAENVCVVTFRPLRDDLVWNTRVGTSVPVEQSSVPVCQKKVTVGR